MKNEIDVPQNPCESSTFGGGATSKQQLKDSLTLHEDSCIMGSFKKVKSAFTLAEALIVVAILGVVAVITIPNLIKNQIEAQNRTKVKKAMSVYERALSKMAIENELKTDNMINTWAKEETDCGNTFKYFKASQGQGCIFKTSDGVWWDITNILRPVIYLKREGINSNNKETVTGYAKDPDNKEAFILVGRFEDAISALRINDKAFEDSHTVTNDDDFDGTSTKAKLEKLYGFMGNKTNTDNSPYCVCNGDGCCSSGCAGKFCFEKLDNCTAESNRWTVYGGANYSSKTCTGNFRVFNPDGTRISGLKLYEDGSAIFYGGFFYGINNGELTMGVNRGSTQLSDMKWDKDGNLIQAKSTSLGNCSKTSCNINPSPLTAEACQKGKACFYDTQKKEWVTGYDVASSTVNDTFSIVGDYIWDNYQKSLNKNL